MYIADASTLPLVCTHVSVHEVASVDVWRLMTSLWHKWRSKIFQARGKKLENKAYTCTHTHTHTHTHTRSVDLYIQWHNYVSVDDTNVHELSYLSHKTTNTFNKVKVSPLYKCAWERKAWEGALHTDFFTTAFLCLCDEIEYNWCRKCI